jgi:dTDP-4-dehydrorhamnose reductase
MKIFITGAGGMLGTELMQELGRTYEISGANAKECDVTDYYRVNEIISNQKPDVIIHTAAYTDVDGAETDQERAFRVNGEGARNVALVAREIGAKMYHISTDYIFGGAKKMPYVEDDPPNPLGIYAKSKLQGEQEVQKHLENHLIIRTAWLYGKHGDNFVKSILRLAKTRDTLRVVNDQIGSPTYTKDLCWGIKKLLALETVRRPSSPEIINSVVNLPSQALKHVTGIIHLTNSGSCSWYEFTLSILKYANLNNIQVLPISTSQLRRPALRPYYSVLSNAKFKMITGYEMRPWESGLKEYLSS